MTPLAARTGRSPRWRRDEAGDFSLVEVVVCLALLSLLGAVVFPLVASFSAENTSVTDTYDAVDQLIEPTQILAMYLHEAVEPASGGTVLSIATYDEIQFTADVGLYNAGSGPYGPARITVDLQTGSDGKPALVASEQSAQSGTCPGVTSGTACTWGTSHQLFSVPDVTDGTSSANPIFEFAEEGSGLCVTSCTLSTIQAVQYAIDTQNHTALAGGSQSEAFFLAPSYSASVG